MLRGVAVDGLKQQTFADNVSIAESYIELVWKGNSNAVAIFKNNISEKDKADPNAMKLVQDFGKYTVQYFKAMPLLRVNIYNSVGSLLLTSNVNSGDTIIGRDISPDSALVQGKLRSTDITSQIVKNVKLQNGGDGTVLQTIVPVVIEGKDGGAPSSEGMIELITDLTTPIGSLEHTQILYTSCIIGFFVLFIVILSVMAKKAEAIIAKQHETNIELSAEVSMAQSENRDKSQFLANVSHELRTPLNAIIGFSEIIKNSSVKEMEEQKFEGYISDIHSSGVHLLSLINDILDYSKAEAGKLELEVAEANLNKLVHNCVRLVTPRAESAQVALVEALPKETLNIVTDSKKFKQILLNLLSNAIKFTPAGGEVRITAWSAIHDDTYMFEVKDSGIGIAPKDISRAMAPFGQVDSALSRKYEGTGLGLPLTKKFVELMGGKFEIESEVGVGTTIRFSVPREIKPNKEVVVKNAE